MKKYEDSLSDLKKQKILNVQDETFINNDLMWQDTDKNLKLKLNRLEFKVYCRNLELANRKDWRVPTYKELNTLVDYNKIDPANLDKIEFVDSLKYWSSTPDVLEKNKNWFIDFTDGSSDTANDLERLNVRCVRDISSIKGSY